MEGRSTGNSRRKSYTTKFKLEVIEVTKEKWNREAGKPSWRVFGNGGRLKES
jgi:hypothetical protein